MTIEIQGGQRTEQAHKLVAASISQDLGFLLAKLHAAGSVVNNRALAEFDLKERSYSVLILANSGLEPTQREMADFLSLDPSQIVALVDELEKRGLVARAPGKQDRRAKTVTATAKGGKLLGQASEAARRAEAEVLDGLPAEESAQLKALLRKALWGAGLPE
ncbi:DNA-binding MarR family transcriptional regulator [Arthrobacter sp. PvP102]|jgi:DNA-binding MarR family transcriptional regulator|uniref:MarR family winged helix-turn-helix transcriptional regulator n=1 Tax=unclassified Arthrobacter TaxID=235627 RepID=UPI0000526D72|nr:MULTISPECIES: MarR family transcriptional regulator [unclassified Arthrobacter]ABK05200.1 transcriptional regulator, MarR family [Arthrobacter sp. FB24]MBP1233218.1 DNA-binding MarR family transcriptional regulator [Arthrobacter sp. PvP103]MBP1238353.1 DNA-binding MarR family transcriptional regulator [Arthrobacter sp. PvP102]